LLPDLSDGFKQSQLATGTEGCGSVLAFCLAQNSAAECISAPSNAAQDASGDDREQSEIDRGTPSESADSPSGIVVRLTGFEPVTYGLGNRCSIP
jgi:hypothetical protein